MYSIFIHVPYMQTYSQEQVKRLIQEGKKIDNLQQPPSGPMRTLFRLTYQLSFPNNASTYPRCACNKSPLPGI